MPRHLFTRQADSLAHTHAHIRERCQNALWLLFAYANVIIHKNLLKGTLASDYVLAMAATICSLAMCLISGTPRRNDGPQAGPTDPEWDILENTATDSKLVEAAVAELKLVSLNVDQAKAVKKHVINSIAQARSELQAAGYNVPPVFREAEDSDWEIVMTPAVHVDTSVTVRAELETVRLDIRLAKDVHKRIAREILEATCELRLLRDV